MPLLKNDAQIFFKGKLPKFIIKEESCLVKLPKKKKKKNHVQLNPKKKKKKKKKKK